MSDRAKVGESAQSAATNWEQATENLKTDFQTRAGAVLDAFRSANWAGDDHAGDTFKKAIEVPKVHEFLEQPGGESSAAGVVDRVANHLGPSAPKVINNSLDSDHQQADELKKAQRELKD
jgi:hypothetical protein